MQTYPPDASAAKIAARDPWCAPIEATEDVDLQVLRETGATGLEPATSGVTGQVGLGDARRQTLLNGLICWAFLL